MTRPTTPRPLEPDRFCRVCGSTARIHVREGFDLCLDYFREHEVRMGRRRAGA